jgi:hypothetical protein
MNKCNNFNEYINHFSKANILVNLVNRRLPDSVCFSVIMNSHLSSSYCAVEYLIHCGIRTRC